MKRLHKRHILLSLLVGTLGFFALQAYLHREPRFEGKRFSEWIWKMNGAKDGPEKEKARGAVRVLGSNSVPLLLDWLRQEDRPSMVQRLDDARHGIFNWLVKNRLIKSRSIASLNTFNPSRRAMAMWALPQLDSTSRKTAIPVLIRLLGEKSAKSDEYSVTAGCACLVLAEMSPDSIDPLVVALSSDDKQTRLLAVGALGRIGPAASKAIPFLEPSLVDKEPMVRLASADVIGKLGGQPESFMPVIVQALSEAKPEDLDWTLTVLLDHKQFAKSAVPILNEIASRVAVSTNLIEASMSYQITNAIKEIEASVPGVAPSHQNL